MTRRFVAFALIFLVMPGLQAAVYYVANGGDDTGPGTDSQPWETPGHGSKQLESGDTLIIRDGVYEMDSYWDDMITPLVSGIPDAWITIRGETGSRPLILGRNWLFAAVEIGGREYISVENLEIASDLSPPYAMGFRVGIDAGGGGSGPVAHIRLRDLYMHHLEMDGINFSGDIQDVLVENVTVMHTAYAGIACPAATGNGWENVVIRNYHAERIGYFFEGLEQPSPYDRPDGIGIEPGNGPVEIADSFFMHIRGDGIDLKTRASYVHHTIVANVSCDSIKLWGSGSRVENVLIYGDGDGNPDNGPWASIVVDGQEGGTFEFVNVTVDENIERNNYPIYMQYGIPVPIQVVMRNCIVAHAPSVIYMGDSVTLVCDHNLFFRGGDPSEPLVYANGRDYLPSEMDLLGAGNISVDPVFIQRAWGSLGDYHLDASSPAINTGTCSAGAPVDDLEYFPRPYGYGCDMGAYEWNDIPAVPAMEPLGYLAVIGLLTLLIRRDRIH